MPDRLVVIFHQPAHAGDPPLIQMLADIRLLVGEGHATRFRGAGAERVQVLVASPGAGASDASFGERLARLVRDERPGGLVVLGSGSVGLLRHGDAVRLLDVAGSGGRHALTNNRFSSDVCAVSQAVLLVDLPPLPSDNALPRWLAERAGYAVGELPGRARLALDIDTPLDAAIVALAPGAPAALRRTVSHLGLEVPRLDALRAVAGDPGRELLVFGRAGAATLRWLERHIRCRVRFLAEERGLRASSTMATGAGSAVAGRPPRATLGRLLELRGPDALAQVVGELADGALIDSRVLLADRLGSDESAWPGAADRYASDLLRPDEVRDPWLRALTASAAGASIPILLGGHTLVSPGAPLLLRPRPTLE